MDNINVGYSHNLILNVGGESWQTEALTQRVKNSSGYNGQPIREIQIKDMTDPASLSRSESALFEAIDSASRIYIMDHGYRAGTTETCHHVHFSDYGKMLATHLGAEARQGDGKLKISLILCNSAGGDIVNAKDSFGGWFHANLANRHGLGLVEVTGRTGATFVDGYAPERGKVTCEWKDYDGINKDFAAGTYDARHDTRLNHQRPGSKVVYLWNDKGQQVIVDAYVLKVLREANALKLSVQAELSPTEKEESENLIDRLNQLTSLPPEQMDAEAAREAVRVLATLIEEGSVSDALQVSVKELEKRSEKIVSDQSHKPELSGRQLNTLYQGVDRDTFIKQQIYSPVQEPLKLLPKTDQERPFKQDVQRTLLAPIGKIAWSKFQAGEEIAHEEQIAQSLAELAQIVADHKDISDAPQQIKASCAYLVELIEQGGYRKGQAGELARAVQKLEKTTLDYLQSQQSWWSRLSLFGGCFIG